MDATGRGEDDARRGEDDTMRMHSRAMTTTTGASVDGGTMTTTKAEKETSRDAMWAALSAVTPERCEEMRESEGGEARARARGKRGEERETRG